MWGGGGVGVGGGGGGGGGGANLYVQLKELSLNLYSVLIFDHSMHAVIVVCRRGNDSQLAVRRLQQVFEDQREKSDSEPKEGGGSSSPAYTKGPVSVRDIVGGLERWSKEVDSTFPQY